MARKFIKTKYPGVYYRESEAKDGGKERIYAVWYADGQGKGHWHTVGKHSQGIRPPYCNQVREDLIKEVEQGKNPAKLKNVTVGYVVDAYLTWAEHEGKHTVPERNRYKKHLEGPIGAVPVQSVTQAMLAGLKSKLLQSLSAQSVRHAFGILRRAVNYALASGMWQGGNPFTVSRATPFQMPQPDNMARRFLTRDEAINLLAALRERSPQLHDMALLSLKTGMRATEIFSITRQQINTESRTIFFTAKGGQHEQVHAPQDIIDMLVGYGRRPEEYIFQAEGGGKLKWGISETFNRVLDDLKFNDGVSDPRFRVRFHTLRHTFASWLAQSGKVTIHELKELMRHRRIEMTMRYAHLLPGHQKNSISIIDDILSAE